MKILSLILFLFTLTGQAATWNGWSWDWRVRLDGAGKPWGYYDTTPIPVTESSSTYSITNEDGTTEFTLGTIVFADNTLGGTTTTYVPATRASTGGSATAYSSIAAALAAVSAGNKTILIRSGTYNESSLVVRSGTDATHRYSLIGYNQERPVIDVGSNLGAFDCVGESFFTIQRVKIQNANESSIFAQNSRNALFCDVWSYFANDVSTTPTDGHIVLANSTNAWNYHVTVQRGYGHGIKMSDGCGNSLTEFCRALETGWWTGATTNTLTGHPVGIDYPDCSSTHTLRYSQVATSLFNSVQVRGNTAYGADGIGTVRIYNNEIFSAPHFEDVVGEASHDTAAMVIFNGGYIGIGQSNIIHFYGNIVRDSSDSDARGIRIYDAYDSIFLYNNLVYGNRSYDLEFTSAHSGVALVWGNAFYDSDADEVLVRCLSSSTPDFKNNVFYQAGAANAVALTSGTHTYNYYYAPSSAAGVSMGTGETTANPQWTAVPSGEWSTGEAYPADGSPLINAGTTMSSLFTVDFLKVTLDGSPDIGAMQWVQTVFPNIPRVHGGLRGLRGF